MQNFLKGASLGMMIAYAAGLGGCTSDKAAPADQSKPADTVRDPCNDSVSLSFQQDIKPIFETHCAKSGCHKRVGNADYAFVDHQGIANGVTQGNVLGAIKHKPGFSNMPQLRAEPLPDTTICKIERWAKAGAPDN